jgi:hypothetical protein
MSFWVCCHVVRKVSMVVPPSCFGHLVRGVRERAVHNQGARAVEWRLVKMIIAKRGLTEIFCRPSHPVDRLNSVLCVSGSSARLVLRTFVRAAREHMLCESTILSMCVRRDAMSINTIARAARVREFFDSTLCVFGSPVVAVLRSRAHVACEPSVQSPRDLRDIIMSIIFSTRAARARGFFDFRERVTVIAFIVHLTRKAFPSFDVVQVPPCIGRESLWT